eukprot:scaffold75_cov184-Alexandrium_tamarense.AAC.2
MVQVTHLMVVLGTCTSLKKVADAFTLTRPSTGLSTGTPHYSTTSLCASKRRGKLGNNIALNEDGEISRIMTKKEKMGRGGSKMNNRRGKSSGSGGEAAISPLLAEWAKSDGGAEDAVASSSSSNNGASAANASVFSPFQDDDKSFKAKKSKQSTIAQSAAQSEQTNDLLDRIQETLSTPNCDVPTLLSYISSLVQVGSATSTNANDQILLPTLKSILSKKATTNSSGEVTTKTPSYRLQWAGSDNSICHIGTSLHKVPLARLQEIYLCLGYNRWELLEVIRILGPFPNVRNTLKGDVKLEKKRGGFGGGGVVGAAAVNSGTGREGVRLTIAYNSMIDGTGKEILAGKADNVKYVMLDVWFANEKAIVCTVVPSVDDDDGEGGDPLMSGNGEKVLLFVAEENLEEELEKLRAA